MKCWNEKSRFVGGFGLFRAQPAYPSVPVLIPNDQVNPDYHGFFVSVKIFLKEFFSIVNPST